MKHTNVCSKSIALDVIASQATQGDQSSGAGNRQKYRSGIGGKGHAQQQSFDDGLLYTSRIQVSTVK